MSPVLRSWCLAVTVGGLAACDCDGDPVTEIMVAVGSDLDVPEELATLALRVDSIDGSGSPTTRFDEQYAVVDAPEDGGQVDATTIALPIRLGVVPRDADDAVIRVEATGGPGPGGAPVTVSASLAFVPGRALLLELFLTRACAGVSCGPGETCRIQDGAAGCAPEEVTDPACTLPDLHSGAIEDCADEPDGCDDRVCPPLTECVAGACVSNDPCDGVVCEGEQVCSFGDCVSPLLDEDDDGYPAVSDCDDRDPDVHPGSTRACSSPCGDGVSVCEEAQWRPCTAPTDCACEPGEERTESCGRCGTVTRRCAGDGEWESGTTPCEGEGECSAGAVGTADCESATSCGRRSRICGDDCAWGDYGACEDAGECEPGEDETADCDACGTETRTCTAQCVWSSWGPCEDQGECSVDATETQPCGSCGTETRTCSATCTWGDWGPCEEGCTPGETETQPCGSCGSQTRTCGDNCNWGGWGTCTGEGECAALATESRACGNCGTQSRTCSAACTWGAFAPCAGEGVCAPAATRTVACNECGSQDQVCNGSCVWADAVSCGNTAPRIGDCVPSDPCNGTATCDANGYCNWSGCATDEVCCGASGCHECCVGDAAPCEDLYGVVPCATWECPAEFCSSVAVPDGTDPGNECTAPTPNCCSGDCGAC